MFRRLVLHFSRRIVQSGSEDSGDVQMSLGAALALLATPGVFLAIGLLDKYSSLLRYFRGRPLIEDHLPRSVSDGYSLLVFSMAVTGLVTIWKWDKILPDLTDRLNLGPLPIRSSTIFLSSLSAIALVVAVFIVDVNAGSMLLFPMVVTADQESPLLFLRLTLAHLIVLLLGSAFAFCLCFSLMGVLIAAAPPSWFGSLSVLMRSFLGLTLAAMLFGSGQGAAAMRTARLGGSGWFEWSPPIWFASLYGPLVGRPELGRADLWQRGLVALAIVLIVALLAYALGYKRGLEGMLARSPRMRRWPRWLIDRGHTPLERAAFAFSMRLLWRSERHSLIVVSALGFGCLAGARSSDPNGIPFCAGFTLAVALRAVLDIASHPAASWPFRMLGVAGGGEPHRIARRVLWVHLAAIVVAPTLLLCPLATSLTLVTMLAVLVEILLLSYRQIPFTVKPAGFRNTRLVQVLMALIGMGVFPWAGTRIASSIAVHPLRAVLPLAIVAIVLRQRDRVANEMYSDRPPLAFEEEEQQVTRLGL